MVSDMEPSDVTLLFRVLFDVKKELVRIADAVEEDGEEEEEDS